MSRYIDADALMREFVEFVRASNNSDFAEVPTWNDAVSLLGSAPTIDPVKHGEWNPVTEVMPPADEIVLVTCQPKRGAANVNRAYWADGSWHGSGSMANVTAWMKLPEPYEGGEE